MCSCLPGYFGGPPNCRPECLLSSECQLSQACVQQKCVDPCPRTCGANAECKVVNHNPICSCPKGYSGDPFFNCNKDPEVVRPPAPHIPCVPDPCGPNSICREINGFGFCSCQDGYKGDPFSGCSSKLGYLYLPKEIHLSVKVSVKSSFID